MWEGAKGCPTENLDTARVTSGEVYRIGPGSNNGIRTQCDAGVTAAIITLTKQRPDLGLFSRMRTATDEPPRQPHRHRRDQGPRLA